MADVFDEVSEDLRRERALKLWKKFAPLLGGAAIAIVLATAGYDHTVRFWEVRSVTLPRRPCGCAAAPRVAACAWSRPLKPWRLTRALCLAGHQRHMLPHAAVCGLAGEQAGDHSR